MLRSVRADRTGRNGRDETGRGADASPSQEILLYQQIPSSSEASYSSHILSSQLTAVV